MARNRWIYINGEAIPADDYEALAAARGHSTDSNVAVRIMPDLPNFVSPIDGKQYSGRAGMREHCAKHNVVPTADLAGLPPKPLHWIPKPTKREEAARKENIARIIDNYARK
jgi:hypothetical protein